MHLRGCGEVGVGLLAAPSPPSEGLPAGTGVPHSRRRLWGAGAATRDPILRAGALSSWPEAFLALPLMAALLDKLRGHMLLESFWN